ncbi:phytanoyl-CoA dioxygenase family protein [Crocinitomix sp.]|nr:phytanoyl-CoA dioxygenase family protein [Crocinitomix sp.]
MNNMKIAVIGDSHSRSYSFNDNFIPLFVGQGKEYNFVSDHNLNNVIKGVERVLPNIREKKVLLIFGEPDTRFYLGKGWTPWTEDGEDDLSNYDTLINESAERYRSLIRYIKKKFDKEIYICNITPSLRSNQNLLVKNFNNRMSIISNDEGVNFVDIGTDKFSIEEIKEIMGDTVHCSNKIQTYVENWFIKNELLTKSKYNKSDWNNKEVQSQFDYDKRFGCYKLKTMNQNIYIENKEEIILDVLKENGIAVIEEFYDLDTVKELIKEFNFILSNEISGVSKFDYSVGQCKIINKLECDFANFKKTQEIFYRNDFQDIADAYLKVNNELNKEIFVVKDIVGSKHHANDLHFDVVSTFKFFIYLTDTNEENGAFSCVPGSHKRTAKIREELGDDISYENRELTRKLPYTEDEVISVNGKAGTLIIFDTDVFHKAGNVIKGERLVMRGHTRPIKTEASSSQNPRKASIIQRILRKIRR